MTYVIDGVLAGATYSLMAMGIVLIYSVVRAFQLAHGALVMLAAYLFLITFDWVGHPAVALVVTILAISVLSLVISRVAFEPLLGRHFPSLVTGLAISLLINQIAQLYFFNGLSTPYPRELRVDWNLTLGDVVIDGNRVLVLVVAVIAIIVLDQVSNRSRIGMQMRAVADSPDGAQLNGINLTRTIRTAFVIAGVAACLAGILLGFSQSAIDPSMGEELMIKGIAAALLGGATSLRGAVVGSMVIGLSQSLAIGYVSATFSDVIAYGVIVAVLFLRPSGVLSGAKS